MGRAADMSRDHRYLSAFLDAQAAEANSAQNTLLAYGRDLRDFLGFVAGKNLDLHLLGLRDLEAYAIAMEAEGLAQSTRARRLSAIRQFFRFLHEDGVREDNPALKLKGPGKTKSLPKTLSVEQVDRLLAAAETQGRNLIERSRNTCLLQLLYATGMRVTELVSLPVSSARGDPEMLLVKGKGGKERLVPLTGSARKAMATWLKVRDNREEAQLKETGVRPSGFLFPSSAKSGHLSRIAFFTLIKKIAVSAGINADQVTPHTLRHAFASHLLAGGADLRAIQTLLGHADIATTEIYTHILDDRLKSLVLEHHPLADDEDGRS